MQTLWIHCSTEGKTMKLLLLVLVAALAQANGRPWYGTFFARPAKKMVENIPMFNVAKGPLDKALGFSEKIITSIPIIGTAEVPEVVSNLAGPVLDGIDTVSLQIGQAMPDPSSLTVPFTQAMDGGLKAVGDLSALINLPDFTDSEKLKEIINFDNAMQKVEKLGNINALSEKMAEALNGGLDMQLIQDLLSAGTIDDFSNSGNQAEPEEDSLVEESPQDE